MTILVRERFPRKAGGRIIPPEWTSISTFCGMPHAMHMHIFTSAGKRHEMAKIPILKFFCPPSCTDETLEST